MIVQIEYRGQDELSPVNNGFRYVETREITRGKDAYGEYVAIWATYDYNEEPNYTLRPENTKEILLLGADTGPRRIVRWRWTRKEDD